MKSLYLNKMALAILTASITLLACEKKKEIIAPWDVAGPDGSTAHLRIVHASPNFRAVTGRADSLHVFVNSTKITGTRLSFGGFFPSQSVNGYAAVTAGNASLRISVGGVVNYDSINVITMAVTMNPGQYYSLIITDSILNASKDSSKIFMQDAFTTPNTGSYGLRVVNAMVDTGANQRVDIWSARRNNNLFNNLATGAIGSFGNQPFINIPDTLIVRRAGTTTELARINTITFANTRVYTLFVRGQVNVTGTKAKTLSFYTNR